MHYDPVKYTLAKLLRGRILRRAFHLGLDMIFLRAWYVRKELKRIADSGLRIAESRLASPKSKIRILDAGMGFGQYSDRMARLFKGAKITGLEIDKAHLYGGEEYFRAVHPGFNFAIGDVQILPFKANSFDLIVTVDVMEHIPDDRATFAEYARVLRPGGRLLMHTPRDRTEKGKGKREGGDHEHWDVGEHVRDGYRDADAKKKIEAAGLTVEHVVRGYGKPGMVAWTLLQRFPMTWLGWSKAMIPVVAFYLVVVLPVAVVAMAIDRAPGDREDGGSLMISAVKKQS